MLGDRQLTGLRKPKYEPTKMSGTEIPNHKASNATKVPKGMAAEDRLLHSIRFKIKKIPNMILERKKKENSCIHEA